MKLPQKGASGNFNEKLPTFFLLGGWKKVQKRKELGEKAYDKKVVLSFKGDRILKLKNKNELNHRRI